MKFLPIKTIGIFGVSKFHQIHAKGTKEFFLISEFSSIHEYEIKKLKMTRKSPFLHHNYFIGNVLTIKNRIFATIESTLHILDFSIPLTRLKLFKKKISKFLSNFTELEIDLVVANQSFDFLERRRKNYYSYL